MEVEKARQILENGGIVIFPTETAYGIAADARNSDAVEKVYKAKERSRSKGLTTIVNSKEQAEKYGVLTEKERRLVDEHMPGPLTLVVPKDEGLAENLNEQFVFRISSSEFARKLAREFPITATSANISGKDTSYSIEEISSELINRVDAIVDHGELECGPTSTIAEIVDGEVVVHREGPISLSELQQSLK